MQNPAISVIIPVYNTEKELGKCIRSVINQDFKDIEIILVNDGSKDGSLRICKRYAEKDSRIVVIDQPNAGRIQARKNGVLHSKGELLFFMDCDDYIEHDALSRLIRLARLHDLDMVAGNHNIVFDNWGLVSKKAIPYHVGDRLITCQELISLWIGLEGFNSGGVLMWGCLYRRLCVLQAMVNHEERLFPSGKNAALEDLSFNLAVAPYLKSSWLSNEIIYHYRYGGCTSRYHPHISSGGYYFDFRYERCVANHVEHLMPQILSCYSLHLKLEIAGQIHFKKHKVADIRTWLMQEFSKRKIAVWAQQHINEIPAEIMKDPKVRAVAEGDIEVFLDVAKEYEKFLRRHHYWKMRLISYYQKIADRISLLLE